MTDTATPPRGEVQRGFFTEGYTMHAVETMFSYLETPWHGLGRVLPEAPSIEAGLHAAGLDWRVACRAVECDGQQYPELGQIVVRMSDRKPLGCVGPSWRPLQNADAFEWFAPFVDIGAATLETAGALHGGRVVWILARLSGVQAEARPGDTVLPYLLLSNSHDGSAAVRVGFTPIRVVCHNTLSASHRDAASKLLRIRHTAGLHTTLAEVRECVNTLTAEFQATAEQYRKLASRKINRADLRKYVTQVVATDPRILTPQEEAKIDDACELAESGRGNLGVSLWDAYNGVTEYLSYAAGRSQDTRLNSLWFGTGKALNDYAYDLAVQLAG